MRHVERREMRAAAPDLENGPLLREEVVEVGDRAQAPSHDLVALDEAEVALRLVGVLLLPLVSEALLCLGLVIRWYKARNAIPDRIHPSAVSREAAIHRLG